MFSDFSPEVEALSLDEAFLDMTGSEQLFGDPQSIGRRLKDAVREATGGLTASVGLSGTKHVAKVASACLKPDGLTGVQRPTITNAAREFERARLVAPGQRQITILDRPGLMKESCECYQLVRARTAFHLPQTYS